MSNLTRIGVALDADLLDKFDALIHERGYENRSEAFRDLIRNELVEASWKSPDTEVVGSVTLVYDHHVRLLHEKLLDLQHGAHEAILSTLHVHLDHDNCLEVLLIKGAAAKVQRLANAIISTKPITTSHLRLAFRNNMKSPL